MNMLQDLQMLGGNVIDRPWNIESVNLRMILDLKRSGAVDSKVKLNE